MYYVAIVLLYSNDLLTRPSVASPSHYRTDKSKMSVSLPISTMYILLESSNHEVHMLELRAVFQRLTDFGLRISPLKCEFGALSMEFLGHLINKDGIAPLPEKVTVMRSYETPRTAKELRRYLGMINFYRRFVPKSAETLQPLPLRCDKRAQHPAQEC